MKQARMSWAFPTLFTSFMLTLGACGQGPGAETSTPQVTNGIKVSANQYPAVVLLRMVKAGATTICTGTFVSDRQLITAGHCVEGLQPDQPNLAFIDQRNAKAVAINALSFRRNPRYSMQESNGVNGHDLAVVTFPAATAPATAGLANAAPKVESELVIVGFGNNKNYMTPEGQFKGSGAGEKRVGRNVVAERADGFISFYGVPEQAAGLQPGERGASGSGDSGGPMFVDGKLVGVTSGGGLAQEDDGSYFVVSRYVDLNSDESLAFLQSQLR